MTKKQTNVTVKSSRFVGSNVLSKGKLSIMTFADSIVNCFDIVTNPEMIE